MLVCCTATFNTTSLEDLSSFGTSFHEAQGILGICRVPPPGPSHCRHSEAAQSFSDSDPLAWLQVEAEVLRSFEQQNNGGAEVKLSNRRPLLQGYACGASRGHAPITAATQKLVPRTNVAAVKESAFGVARHIRLQLLNHIQAPSGVAHISMLGVNKDTHLVEVNPDGAHVRSSHGRQREEAVLPLADERHALVKAEKLFHQTSHTRVNRH